MYRSGYLQGAGVNSTSDTKLGEPFLKGVDALCRRGRIRVGMPKSARMV